MFAADVEGVMKKHDAEFAKVCFLCCFVAAFIPC
jgi:hypothetical protein